ncbi:hypothetical protein [Micavibrio aeruginosavorus]|uniref:hypothetical protein n=1 Tax=Micavibrio aeruginosavorus TaxID=349221 RepID=UPI003F4A9E3C
MFSNSQFIFSDIAAALYRAGLYVSYADQSGGRRARVNEYKAIQTVLRILHQQNSPESFIHDLAKLAEQDMVPIEKIKNIDKKEVHRLETSLKTVPSDIETIMLNVIDNFSKPEARLYADIILSIGASVAQTHYEWTDTRLIQKLSDALWPQYWPEFTAILYERIIYHLSNLNADKDAKYLYAPSNPFDEMNISLEESDALSELARSVQRAWQKRYPVDFEATVQDYIRNG